MTEARITIWPHARIRGWDGQGDIRAPELQSCPSVPLALALEHEHATDAHFVPYYLPGHEQIPRMKKAALAALKLQGPALRFTILPIDVDCPEAHRENAPAPAPWREAQARLRDDLPEELWEGMGWYETRGGYRLLWQLPEELDADQYITWVAGMRADLAEHGIEADKLRDWGRCYRLPRVNRGGERQDYPLDLSGLAEPMQWRPRTSIACAPADPVTMQAMEALDGLEKVRTQPFELPTVIGSGDRNRLLTSYAGKLRYAGAGEGEMLESLRSINQARCRPPCDDEELVHIAHSVAGYEPGQAILDTQAATQAAADAGVETSPNSFSFKTASDPEIMEKTIAVLEEQAGGSVIADRGHLWRYCDPEHYWQPIAAEACHKVTMGFDGQMVYGGQDKDGRIKLKPLVMRAGTVYGAHKLALSARHKPRFFDDAPRGLALANGFAAVSPEGLPTFLPHSPEHRSMYGLPFDYVPGAKPTQFLTMLRQCFQPDADAEAKIALLREWVGVALLGHATTFERGLILVGEGANGKSTVQRVITALFPPDAVTAIAPQAMDNEYRRAALATSLLNCVAEMPEADLLESTSVKALLSGDAMDAREIREAPFRFRPRAAHLFSANTLPAVRDLSHGFWRRWAILVFPRRFEPEEQDRGLAKRIIREELGEVVSWCLDGGAALVKRGAFRESSAMLAAISDWRIDSNPVAAWVSIEVNEDATDKDGQRTAAGTVYQRYSMWALENGHVRMSQTKFGRRMASLGYNKRRGGSGRYEYTIALHPVGGAQEAVLEARNVPQ